MLHFIQISDNTARNKYNVRSRAKTSIYNSEVLLWAIGIKFEIRRILAFNQ